MKAFVLNGDIESQKLILQANIPFVELYKRARFTYMEDPTNDPYDETDNVPVNEYYQRRVDEERVKNFYSKPKELPTCCGFVSNCNGISSAVVC